jgi:16S rRNA (guanine527-N7)-methyltransferase
MEKAPANLELITQYFADFTPEQLQQLAALESLYNDWNSKINVISRKDIEGLYEKHVLHSLSIAAVFEFPANSSVIDIGTGGGFPGIPLAIFFPDVQFHLVDSIGKKLKVVNSVAAGLGLLNITTQHIRAEEIKNRKFDFAVSRAVAPLGELWKWAKPLLKKPSTSANGNDLDVIPGPGLICLKGGDLTQEIQESGCRPRLIEISELFDREYFKEKFLLFVAK